MCYSGPRELSGRARDYWIKVTLGITALFSPIVHIEAEVCDLDVDSRYPRAGEGSKGAAVLRIKSYVSWV